MSDKDLQKSGVQLDLSFDMDYFVIAAEAALFAVGSAIKFDKLAESLDTKAEYIPIILEELQKRYKTRETSIEVIIMEDCAVLCTKSIYGNIVRKALEIRKNQPLSKAALEVLAVIAYNQPTTRAFVEKVRGVESPSVVSTLVEKGLIEECGRLDTPGRPVLYATTPIFLRTFGLASINELGSAPEFSDPSIIEDVAAEEEMFGHSSYEDERIDIGISDYADIGDDVVIEEDK